ncbi:MAG: MBL fold metallo-hydrolase [Xanthomonadaceae bacterium]|jgi:glyoxylase-like metal-dependent hydrolase (beta-lactamase superfamily II)|nr:MBL fold metallo-hydrolase [Xanthomonadaceae bacterium]
MRALEWQLFEAGYCTHAEWAARKGGSRHRCQFPALAALIRHPDVGAILFDTGYSEAFLRATEHMPERLYRVATPVQLRPGESLREQLRGIGLPSSDIRMIVLSHLHGDHVGGIQDFPRAMLFCAQRAWDDMTRRGRLNALSKGLLPGLVIAARNRLHWLEQRPAVALPPAFSDFGDGRDVLGDGALLAVPLPGHAAGQYGLLFRETSGRMVFLIADAAWSSQAIRDGVPPPRLVTGWLGDTRTYRQTLARLHALSRNAPDVRIVPSHCSEWRPDA